MTPAERWQEEFPRPIPCDAGGQCTIPEAIFAPGKVAEHARNGSPGVAPVQDPVFYSCRFPETTALSRSRNSCRISSTRCSNVMVARLCL